MIRLLRASARYLVVLLISACCTTQAQQSNLVGTWAASPMQSAAGLAGQTDETLREVVHVSLASTQNVTVTLSNEFGMEPLTIGAATIGRRNAGSDVDMPVSMTFAGKTSVTIAPGKSAESDPAALTFPAMSDVSVSLFVPAQKMTMVTQHSFADSTNYSAAGDQTAAASLTEAKQTTQWRYLKGVQVSTPARGTVVCFGDSITDDARSTKDANLRWPDILAGRLLGDPRTATLGVLNQGIGGNRILHDTTGPAAVARFERDVLVQPGVKYVVLLEGINDIGHAYDPKKPYDVVSVEEMIAGYKYLAARAHAHGLRVYGATLTPYVGAGYSSPQGEVARQAFNRWILTTKDLDGVIDFDKATRDPANPAMFLPAYDGGDHLHPSDAGYKAMGNLIDLSLFAK